MIALLLLLAAAPPSMTTDPAEGTADHIDTTDIKAPPPAFVVPPLPWIAIGTGLGTMAGTLGGGALAWTFLQRDCDAFGNCTPTPGTLLGAVGLHAVVVVAVAGVGGILGGVAEDSIEAGAIAGFAGGGVTSLLAPAAVLVALTQPPSRPQPYVLVAAATGIGVVGGAFGHLMVSPSWAAPADP